ncbi:replication protein [Bacillus sp. FSL W8-0519]|uniref:replication protein n=1 Tax=Bacillus sp. FSL W8-0519 TaxID=2954624 RepID=UPI0030F9A4FC
MSTSQLLAETPMFVTEGKVSKEELRLPQHHFVAAMDWIDKLGESAYCDYLKLYTMADRSNKQREYDKVPRALASIWDELGRKEKYFRQKVLIPLWEYGLIDLIEYQGERKQKTGHKPMNIIVYRYPCNDFNRMVKPLEKVRDWKTDYKSAAKFYAIKGGRPKKDVKDSVEKPLSKDSTEKPLKDSVQNPNNNTKAITNVLNYFSKYVSIDISPLEFFKLAILEKPTKYIEKELESLTTIHGKDIVNESIKRLADKDTTNYVATIKGIIRQWDKQGMQCFDDIEKVETEYINRKKTGAVKQPKTFSKKPTREELLPSWVKDQDDENTSPKQSEDELAEERKRLEEVLKKYKRA